MHLDNNLAALALGETTGLELRVPMRWETRATAIRAQMGVHNAHDLPLLLGVQVLILKPWKLTAYLMIYGQHLRRLDVNGSHGNRTGDREVWTERTHKHTFSEQHQDTVAYTPGDIPAVPTANIMGDHDRGAFEAFCAEQAIKLTGEYRWIDPILPKR
ncbi:MAG: hypothetical protein ACRDQY_12290 [Pseudonocardiaceae bacterium]